VSLSETLTAFVEFIDDTLVNTCGAEQPDRILRYHGHAPPDELECPPAGILSVWWEPGLNPQSTTGPCQSPLSVNLAARWVTCWKLPEVNEQTGVTLYDTTWDARASVLADVAQCVAAALANLSCNPAPPELATAFRSALLDHLSQPRYQSTSPVGVGGGIAGVLWRLNGIIREPPPPPEPPPVGDQFGRTATDGLNVTG